MTGFDDQSQRDRDWNEIEAAVREFEAGWSVDRTADIANWLPKRVELRAAAIVELVETDLELRIKQGLSARVEDYFEAFPDLDSDQVCLEKLIRAEIRLRKRREPGIDGSEYEHRFPELIDLFSAEFHPPPELGDESGRRRFTLVEPIGSGGLGRVWLAIDHEFDREVAVKEIRPSLREHELSRQRFHNEATITAQLQHPGIITVHARGKFVDGRPYYAMQLIRGVSLQELVERFHADAAKSDDEPRPVAFRRLLRGFVDGCHAIEYAQREGVLHRDIKPQNIMVGSFGETVVVDWGLAKRLSDSSLSTTSDSGRPTRKGSDSTTKTGQALGSPAYMSPEQAAGLHHAIGPPSDVYSLGATLHTILFNKPPTPSYSTSQVTDSVAPQIQTLDQTSKTSSGSTVPQALRAICRKCLATNASDRYQSAQALAEDVQRFLDDQPVSVQTESIPKQVGRFLKRNMVALLATIALAMFLATMWVSLSSRQNRNQLTQESTAYAKLLSELSLEILNSAEPEVAANDPYVRTTITKLPRSLTNWPIDLWNDAKSSTGSHGFTLRWASSSKPLTQRKRAPSRPSRALRSSLRTVPKSKPHDSLLNRR